MIGKIDFYLNENNEWMLDRFIINEPFIKCITNNIYWHVNGKLHRINGPTIERANGDKLWFLNGQYHRIDGPAIEYADGEKLWYVNGKCIDCKSQKEFEKLMKLKAFW